eukprot:TRINITY_DN552_c0_g2_i3.p1 TRINITY_DN552_c0_g2~~TRINITY_DN552_c0_g2_i3.p1  ORF type:complete len:435 (+),score=111.82 TRINITY_DN552_c0_g2_i3:114-1418(+)
MNKDFEDTSYEDTDLGIDKYQKWTSSRKKILLIASLPIILSPLAGSIYVPVYPTVQDHLDASNAVMGMTIEGMNIMLGLMPLLYGPLSDLAGRKIGMLSCILVFFGSCLCCGGAWSAVALVVFRTIMGIGLSGLVVFAQGAVTDIFPKQLHGSSFGLLLAPSLAAPILGPLLGGALTQYFGWRSIFWFQAALALVIYVIIQFTFPETIEEQVFSFRGFNPFTPLTFFKDKHVLFPATARAFTFATMYLVVWSFPIILEENFDEKDLTAGLLLIPFGIATITGSIIGGIAADICSKRLGLGGRLLPLIASSIFTIIFAFAYGMSADHKSVIWLSVIFSALVGFGTTAGRSSVMSFCISRKPHAAGGMTAIIIFYQFFINVVELLLATVLLDIIGIAWIMTISSGLAIIFTIPAGYTLYIFKPNPNYQALSMGIND